MAKSKKKSGALAELAKLREAMKKVIEEKGKPALLEMASEAFAFEEVEAVRWPQYTPSFNDGDPCTFSVGDVTVKLKGTDEKNDEDGDEDYEDEDGFLDSYSDRVKAIKGLGDAMDEIGAALSENEDVLEQVFSNNVKVTVSRDGKIEIDDYDCGY